MDKKEVARRDLEEERDSERKGEKVEEPSRSPRKDPLDQSSSSPSKKVARSCRSYGFLAGSEAVITRTHTQRARLYIAGTKAMIGPHSTLFYTIYTLF